MHILRNQGEVVDMNIHQAMKKTKEGESLSVRLINGVELKCVFESLMFEDEGLAYCVKIIGDGKEIPHLERNVEPIYAVKSGVFEVGTLLELLPGEVSEINGEPIE